MPMLKGLITALVTPFDKAGNLELDMLKASVRFQLAEGTSGLCPLGGTGEPLSLSLQEQQAVIDTVVNETAGQIPVVVGTLSSNANDIVFCGKHAKLAGADAIMVAPPHFYGMTIEHMVRHFQDIADQTDMPMVLFHSPGRTGIKLNIEQITQIFDSTEQFVGIKESSNDMALVAELVERSPSRISILQGYETNYLATLALGGHGAILSLGCLIPRLLQDLYRSYQTGDMPSAQAIQVKLIELCRYIYCEPNPGPLKYALKLARRPAGSTRPPIYESAQSTQQALQHLLSHSFQD